MTTRNEDIIQMASELNLKKELASRSNSNKMKVIKKDRVQVDQMILDYKKAKLREYE